MSTAMNKRNIVSGVLILMLSIGTWACKQKAEEEQYQSIYESEVTIEQLYRDINKNDSNWIMDELPSIQTITEFNGIETSKDSVPLLFEEPPMPQIGIRIQRGGTFLDPQDQMDMYVPFELVVRSGWESPERAPRDLEYRIERLRIEISRPGLIPLEKEYTYAELLQRLDLRNQEQGEYIYRIDPFDLNYNPAGYMMRVHVKAVSRLDPQGKRIALNTNHLNTEFAYRLEYNEEEIYP
jgi:hypothetical protein